MQLTITHFSFVWQLLMKIHEPVLIMIVTRSRTWFEDPVSLLMAFYTRVIIFHSGQRKRHHHVVTSITYLSLNTNTYSLRKRQTSSRLKHQFHSVIGRQTIFCSVICTKCIDVVYVYVMYCFTHTDLSTIVHQFAGRGNNTHAHYDPLLVDNMVSGTFKGKMQV